VKPRPAKRTVDASKAEEAPTQGQFNDFAARLIAVPKAEYEELEGQRRRTRSSRNPRRPPPSTQDGQPANATN
jgi:hypothetical protein